MTTGARNFFKILKASKKRASAPDVVRTVRGPGHAAMILDQHAWLVHKLCGRQGADSRAPGPSQRDIASKTPAHSRAAALHSFRTPGTLAEVIVTRVTGDGEVDLLHDEVQRLSSALMSLQPGDAASSAAYGMLPRSGGGGGVVMLEDRASLSTPLVRHYDEVSARQYERLSEQQREVEQMRDQVQSLRAVAQRLSAADSSRYDLIRGSAQQECEELVSRVESYARENELLKQQLALTAAEITHLHSDLEARTHSVIVLKHEAQRLKDNETTLKNAFAEVMREAKELHARARRSSAQSEQENDVEASKRDALQAETSEWRVGPPSPFQL